jgi:hypothetical protein
MGGIGADIIMGPREGGGMLMGIGTGTGTGP